MPLTIRPFRDSDIDFAVAQAAREGWDCPASAFGVFIAHDPEGCFVAEVDGRRVGMITSTCYAQSAWIGNLIVMPSHRRQGIGERLMRHAIDRLEAGGIETFRLEADPMGVGIYERLGFVPQFGSPRFSRQPPHDAAPSPAERIGAAELDAIAAFDAACFSDDRGRLLQGFLKIAHAAYCVRSGGRVKGFAMALPAALGVRLGPFVAGSSKVAGQLLDSLMADCRDKAIIAAVPGVNAVAVRLFEDRGFDRRPSSLRMLRGEPAAESATETVFALANGATG